MSKQSQSSGDQPTASSGKKRNRNEEAAQREMTSVSTWHNRATCDPAWARRAGFVRWSTSWLDFLNLKFELSVREEKERKKKKEREREREASVFFVFCFCVCSRFVFELDFGES